MFEYSKRLDICDVNKDNIASTRGILRLLQEVSTYHSEKVGYGINDINKNGFAWFLISQKTKIFKRPCWASLLKIQTWSRGIKGAVFLRDYKAFDENNETVCISTSKWAMVDISTGKLLKPEKDVCKKYGICENAVFKDDMKKIFLPKTSEKTFSYTICHRDIDINNHVNNLCYLDFATEALPEGIEDVFFSDIQVDYKHPLFLKNEIFCYYHKDENSHIVSIKSNGNLNALIKFSL